MFHINRLTIAALAVFVVVNVPTFADSLTQVSSRTGTNDTVSWVSLGGDVTSVTTPATVNSSKGITVTVTGSSTLTIFSGSTFNGDFLTSDTLLSAFDLGGDSSLATPIQLNFGSAVSGVVTQIEDDSYGAFTAEIDVYATDGTFLGSRTVNSTVGIAQDGSAVVLGVDSTVGIGKVILKTSDVGVTIDSVSLLETSIPEPGTLAVLPLSLGVLALVRKKRIA